MDEEKKVRMLLERAAYIPMILTLRQQKSIVSPETSSKLYSVL
jgi:hypothetical protein